MKRMLMLLLAMLLAVTCAGAEGKPVEHHVETFGETLPEELRLAMDETAFAKDPVICGATLAFVNDGETQAHLALIAVQHGETRLLLGAQMQHDGWRIRPESETLLREDVPFIITVAEGWGQGGGLDKTPYTADVLLAIDYGEDMFLLKPSYGYSMYSGIADVQWFKLYSYVRMDEAGNGLTITCRNEGSPWIVRYFADGEVTSSAEYSVRWPISVEYIDGDWFPQDEIRLKAWAEQNPPDESAAWVIGANMRQKATSSSASLGMYSVAPLEILGRKSGSMDWWYQVRLGDTEGWISGTYVHSCAEGDTPEEYLRGSIMPALAASSKDEAVLYVKPNDLVKRVLTEGMPMRILGFSEGWYHVQIPEDAAGWRLDVPAEYGYVRQADVQVYASPLCMKYDAR